MASQLADSHTLAEPDSAATSAPGLAFPDAVPARYIVALDFGTSHSGFAFCRKEDPDHIVTLMAWPDQPSPYPKTLTAILYNDQLEPISWGHSAQVQYSKLRSPAGYQYFSHFKLYLDDQYAAQHPAPTVSVDRLIADYLRLMGVLIEETMKTKLGEQAALADVQWCLTVPAMWSDRAKQVMRNAAARAGLITSPTSDRLTLVLEPEAAAATMLQGQSNYLQPGDTFIVFDAGGGTVDLTAQQFHLDPTDGPCFHEIAPGIGKSCGSTFVDQAFTSYFRTTTGAAAFDAWTSASRLGLVHLLHHWEAAKRSFVGPPYRDPQSVHDVLAIPAALRKRMAPDALAALAAAQDEDSDAVHLTNFALMHMFDAVVEQCVGVLDAILDRCARAGHPACKILCVGGFAQSPLLVNRLRMQFEAPGGLHVYCPADPGSAVVTGAVQFGVRAHVYRQRRARLTYGVATSAEWRPHMPVERRVYDARVGRYMATGKVFDALVKFGDVVRPESVVTRVYSAPDADTSKLALELWTSTEVNPVFCDEEAKDGKCIKLADFMVPLGRARPADVDLAEAVANGPTWSASALPRVEVGLQFGNAEIGVSAKNLDTGEVTRVQVEFSDANVDLSKVGKRAKRNQSKRPISDEGEEEEEEGHVGKKQKRTLDAVFGIEGIAWDFVDPMSDEVEPPPPPTAKAKAARAPSTSFIPTIRQVSRTTASTPSEGGPSSELPATAPTPPPIPAIRRAPSPAAASTPTAASSSSSSSTSQAPPSTVKTIQSPPRPPRPATRPPPPPLVFSPAVGSAAAHIPHPTPSPTVSHGTSPPAYSPPPHSNTYATRLETPTSPLAPAPVSPPPSGPKTKAARNKRTKSGLPRAKRTKPPVQPPPVNGEAGPRE